MNKVQALEKVRSMILSLRRIETMIRAIEIEDIDEKIINNCNDGEVRKWLDQHRIKELGELPVSKLRDLARKRRIKNYSRMNRVMLISSLEN